MIMSYAKNLQNKHLIIADAIFVFCNYNYTEAGPGHSEI